MLSEWFEGEEGKARAGVAKSASLVERILSTGIEPFREPPTLPPIRLDEIELICRVAIMPAECEA